MKRLKVETKNKKLTIIIIVLAILSTYAAYIYIQPIIKEKEERATILVATKELKPYSVIEEGDVTYVISTKKNVNSSAIQKKEEIVGKMNISQINRGEQVESFRIGKSENYKDLKIISYQIDINRAVGGTLKTGDLVDLYIVDSTEYNMARKIGPNLRVVDVLDSAGKIIKLEEKDVSVPSIVLLSTKEKEVANLVVASLNTERLVLVQKLVEEKEESNVEEILEGD